MIRFLISMVEEVVVQEYISAMTTLLLPKNSDGMFFL